MIVVLAENREYLRLQERRQKDAESRRRAFWKEVGRWGRLANTWLGVSAFTVVLFSLGSFVGINVPDGVVCRGKHSPCNILRVREGKRVIPAPPFQPPKLW